MPCYKLWVGYVSTASVGRRREVGREEGEAMIRQALRTTDRPEEVGMQQSSCMD